MSDYFVMFWMIFMHVIGDYNLQGWLASAKQKEWWEKNSPHKLYRNDYIWALIMHAFSWTFMIMLPIAVDYYFYIDNTFIVIFCVNWIIHAIVDDLKANAKVINLWVDQIIHLAQIIITASILL